MATELRYNPTQLAALKSAVKRNPAKVYQETQDFFARGLREYNTYIFRAPWRIGGTGGGAPVATGNLRDTHARQILPWEAKITATAHYAQFIHDGTRRMQARPWLEYAQNAAAGAINQLAKQLLDNVVRDLAQ